MKMRSEYYIKMILLSRKQQDHGFTLLELLVVIVMIGILSAMIWPSLLAQVNKAKEVEATVSLGTMNRFQQVFYLENNRFADNLGDLGVGIPEETRNYRYQIAPGPNLFFVTHQAQPLPDSSVRALIGGVGVVLTPPGEALTYSVLCKGLFPAVAGGPNGNEPINFNLGIGPQCPPEYQPL